MESTAHSLTQTTSANGVISERVWIASEILARLAVISTRKSRAAMERSRKGEKWRGHSLVTMQTHGQGGSSGKRLLVALDSLPSELQDRFSTLPIDALGNGVHTFPDETQQSVDALDSKAARTTSESASDRDKKLARRFELDILSLALQHKKHSRERAAAIRSIAAMDHRAPNGEVIRLSAQSIYRKLEKYESSGATALVRTTRTDKGGRRAIVTLQYDDACPLSQRAKQDIADKLVTFIKSHWSIGSPGWRTVARSATSMLVDLSRAAGWQGATLSNCRIPRRIVDKYCAYKLCSTASNDAKKYADELEPRIIRHRDGLQPMETVVGDVHPIDIGVRRPDGSIAYPRAIAWQCVATNRLYITLILLSKGEGVRREHVAQSFIAMCKSFGLPSCLNLDNGAEYSWAEMIGGFSELSRLNVSIKVTLHGETVAPSKPRSIVRSLPYNAQAKPIEGLFAVLERGPLARIPGWVGGDRMRKKTHNVGKAPAPYPGTWEQFHRDFETALQWYHTNPQSKTLGGRSPFEAYMGFIDDGWQKTVVDERTLMVAFASEERRTPDRGYIQWGGKTFYHDALLEHTGKRLTVRVMPLDPRFLFAFLDGQLICAAEPARTFGFSDTAGAIEQARRRKVLRRRILEKRREVDRLDPVEDMRRDLAHYQQMPDAPTGAVITLTPHMQQILDALDAKEEAEEREEFLPPPDEPESMWLPRGARNKYLEALTYLPEDEETDDTTDEEL